MKIIENEEEAIKVRAKLEQEMKAAGQEESPEGDIVEFRQRIKDFYNLMDYILDYYMDIPKETKNIVILWTIGTYFHNNFETFPYLFVNAMRSSGKTRLLKIIQAFSKNSQLVMSLTEAVMFRTVGTLLIDEFEGVNRKGMENLRELLNSAYKKGTSVLRMKKKKTIEGESQVVEDFQPYRPIVMANIWGMEEVLGDRCINIQLEKSNDLIKTRLVEAFDKFESIKAIKSRLLDCAKWSLCSYVSNFNVHLEWNNYLREHLTTPNITTTLTTPNYTNYTKLHEKELESLRITQMFEGKDTISNFSGIFDKILESQIDGRHLELFFPLFLVAYEVGETTLNFTIETAKKVIYDKKVDEIMESKDVGLFNLIALQQEGTFYDISKLTSIFRMTIGEGENDWLNSKWMGRALKRLNLIVQKRKISTGIQVMLNVQKAKLKKEMFNPKDETPIQPQQA